MKNLRILGGVVLGIAILVALLIIHPTVYAASISAVKVSYNEKEDRYTYVQLVKASINDMSIFADRGTWKAKNKLFSANGGVTLKTNGISIVSSTINVKEDSGIAELSGDVMFHKSGLTVNAGNAKYNAKNSIIEFSNGVKISEGGYKKLYNSAVYDISSGSFSKLIE